MGRIAKTLQKVLDPRSEASIRFQDLRRLLLRLGFAERTRGSHHLFRHPQCRERINIQADGSHAKPYQVRQIRRVILEYDLRDEIAHE